MADIRIHHYAVDAADHDEFLARRAALIDAMRARHPGLIEALLVRLDDGTFVDSWRWESAEAMRAALAAAPTFPEIRAAMSLTRDTTNEDGEVVDRR
jgi:hypothetical protein